MTTPHIAAEPGDFAPVVLMPGDPVRARHIAETYLDDPRLVTDVRAMAGFTGTVDGVPVSVMGHGMGIPSANIYATELIRFFGCERLIRVGSCGGLSNRVALRDVIIATGAGTDSNVNRLRVQGHDFPAVADFGLARSAAEAAERKGLRVAVGPVFTSDTFYGDNPALDQALADHGLLAVEMEVAGLYGVAAAEGAAALALLTVSDHLVSGERLSPEDRATSFDDMIMLALAVATG
ncbi:MAG: purine-nucleoside phosphorylase [Acidimicrobiales bacterium]|nr:purine-nucleoside phosphorylase [Acidimicrobiales bacterium]